MFSKYSNSFRYWNCFLSTIIETAIFLRGPAGGGGGSHVARLNFNTSRVGVYKRFTSLSEIERKFFVFVGILEKGDSDAL